MIPKFPKTFLPVRFWMTGEGTVVIFIMSCSTAGRKVLIETMDRVGVIRGHLALGKEVPQLNLAKTFEEICFKPKALMPLLGTNDGPLDRRLI